MLRMIVMSHGPDACAGVNLDSLDKARNGFSQLSTAAEAKQVTVQGAWVYAPAHFICAVIDAPNPM